MLSHCHSAKDGMRAEKIGKASIRGGKPQLDLLRVKRHDRQFFGAELSMQNQHRFGIGRACEGPHLRHVAHHDARRLIARATKACTRPAVLVFARPAHKRWKRRRLRFAVDGKIDRQHAVAWTFCQKELGSIRPDEHADGGRRGDSDQRFLLCIRHDESHSRHGVRGKVDAADFDLDPRVNVVSLAVTFEHNHTLFCRHDIDAENNVETSRRSDAIVLVGPCIAVPPYPWHQRTEDILVHLEF